MSYHFNKCLLFNNFGFTSLCDFKDTPPQAENGSAYCETLSLLSAIHIYGFSSYGASFCRAGAHRHEVGMLSPRRRQTLRRYLHEFRRVFPKDTKDELMYCNWPNQRKVIFHCQPGASRAVWKRNSSHRLPYLNAESWVRGSDRGSLGGEWSLAGGGWSPGVGFRVYSNCVISSSPSVSCLQRRVWTLSSLLLPSCLLTAASTSLR